MSKYCVNTSGKEREYFGEVYFNSKVSSIHECSNSNVSAKLLIAAKFNKIKKIFLNAWPRNYAYDTATISFKRNHYFFTGISTQSPQKQLRIILILLVHPWQKSIIIIINEGVRFKVERETKHLIDKHDM